MWLALWHGAEWNIDKTEWPVMFIYDVARQSYYYKIMRCIAKYDLACYKKKLMASNTFVRPYWVKYCVNFQLIEKNVLCCYWELANPVLRDILHLNHCFMPNEHVKSNSKFILNALHDQQYWQYTIIRSNMKKWKNHEFFRYRFSEMLKFRCSFSIAFEVLKCMST